MVRPVRARAPIRFGDDFERPAPVFTIPEVRREGCPVLASQMPAGSRGVGREYGLDVPAAAGGGAGMNLAVDEGCAFVHPE